MYELHAVSPEGTASYLMVRATTPDLADLAKQKYAPFLNDGSKIELHKVSGFTCVERGDIVCEEGTDIVEVYVLYGYLDGQVIGPRLQNRFRAELETHLGIHVSGSGASLGALTAEGAEAGRAFLKVLATEGSNALQKGPAEELDNWED